jgi:hypothetical protein
MTTDLRMQFAGEHHRRQSIFSFSTDFPFRNRLKNVAKENPNFRVVVGNHDLEGRGKFAASIR